MRKPILVLDDDPAMLEALVETLDEAGYTVVQASDSAQAISWAKRTPLELLVTDVRMAGADGIDTIGILKGMQPNLKGIVITGYAGDTAPARAVQVEAMDYLYKPFGLDELLKAVSRALTREEESRGYQSLLGKVVAGYRSLLEMAWAAAAKAQLRMLEADRDRAFQAFYVSIRSARLSRKEALELWERLVPIEEKREQLKAEGLNLELRSQLADGYNSITVLLGAIERAQQAGLELGRLIVPEQHQRFGHLYERVADGSISLEQLKLAPTLKSLAPEALKGSHELNELYHHVWG